MQVGTADTPLVRVLNATSVLTLVRADHPISRIEIARRIGMTKPTVSNVIGTLLDVGLVREVPTGAAGGRGALFAPVHDVGYAVGVDVGGRYLRAAVTDLSGDTRAADEVAHHDAEPDQLAGLAADLRDRLLADAGVDAGLVAATVVGVAGIVDPTSGQITRTNPFRTTAAPIIEAFGAGLTSHVVVENDINLAALAEQRHGAGHGVDHFAVLSIGTGVGSGIILDGRLHRGHRGAAGELDMPGNQHSPAAHAIVAHAHALIEPGAATTLAVPVTPEAVFAAGARGDAVATAVLAELADRIARMVADIARVVDVELVVLTGGIGSHCGPIIPAITAAVAGRTQFPPRIEVTQLGDRPVLAGALALASQQATDRVVSARLRGEPL